MNIFLFAFLFFLPAGVANMAPIFAAKLPILKQYNKPLDFGKTFHSKRILGDHKTIRGLIIGVLAGVLVSVILANLVRPEFNPILLGFLLSFGALLGDSAKSFFKRQISVREGKSWFPFDQIDYIIGGLLLSFFIVRLTFLQYTTIILLYFVLHILTTIIGFIFTLKQSPI